MGATNDFAHRAMGTILASWLWFSAMAILLSLVRGYYHLKMLALHDRYDPIVRTGPYTLSFNTAQGFKGVYGSRPGVAQFPRNPKIYGPMIPSRDSVGGPISNEAHRRHRRLLAHAFSDRALREQEPRLFSFIDVFISRLRDLAHQSTDIDPKAWLELAAFDITGLDCHTPISGARDAAGGLHAAVVSSTNYAELTINAEKAERRVALGVDRVDFMSAMIKNGLVDDHPQAQEKVTRIGRWKARTDVHVPHYGSYMSDASFFRATDFLPERWLGTDPQFEGYKTDTL
ncbi:cytochrome P450 [Aspergillus japonicus CBS 114.51]|uniref:Cytochrome P450 n=2 Tax=Aspergillus TaxID=5052 RepID=A0A2V5HD98_ASPV1|nr:cytochrome P450 [Aspergillus japonicus CBS 114.51]PYI13900.1 cytochrome P450 [Aspergillus violaceofuscus CBS 115571]RAH86331.1 cytochrome P450 [Aspergillus japonicus CBS 114.51]